PTRFQQVCDTLGHSVFSTGTAEHLPNTFDVIFVARGFESPKRASERDSERDDCHSDFESDSESDSENNNRNKAADDAQPILVTVFETTATAGGIVGYLKLGDKVKVTDVTVVDGVLWLRVPAGTPIL